jgi:hypothetical protein
MIQVYFFQEFGESGQQSSKNHRQVPVEMKRQATGGPMQPCHREELVPCQKSLPPSVNVCRRL